MASCPVDRGNLAHSHGAFNNTDSTFANFSTMNTDGVEGMTAFRGVVYATIMIDVFDSENVTGVWADFKRTNESEWVMASMQRALWDGDNSFQFTPGLRVSQTVTEFDIRFRANDTMGDVSTSQDFSFIITYSPPNTPPYDVAALNNLVKFIIVAAIVLGSIAAIVVVARRGGSREV